MKKNEFSPRTLISISRPLSLVMVLFTYLLGLAALDYLGVFIDWSTAAIGSLVVLALLLSRSFLGVYFGFPEPIHSEALTRTDTEGAVRLIQTDEVPRHVLMQLSLASLGLGALASVLLVLQQAVSLSVILVMALGLALVIADVLPPVQVRKKGYSETIEALLVAIISPALAFLLQNSQLHVLLVMLSLPLTCTYLALKVGSSFEYWAYDTKHAAGSLLSIVGWQRGVAIHNISIGLTYFLFALFLAFKLPWDLTWPIFLSLPLGVFQVVQMTRIAEGAKPNWRLFRLNSLATFLFIVYLVTFRLWSR